MLLEGVAASQLLPCGWVSLVVWWTRCVNALVTSSHVEAHPVSSTLDALFQTLVYICRYSKQFITLL